MTNCYGETVNPLLFAAGVTTMMFLAYIGMAVAWWLGYTHWTPRGGFPREEQTP